ncbi:lamin tail domain-containing protein [Patescibacteria group bacterium]|nr:lamin tail domain-containing protein [Patescibacteria group bacterium]
MGYEPGTTHQALTQEIVNFFNKNYPGYSLSDNEKLLVERGSVDEDNNTRPFRHFYDPVHNRGLSVAGKEFLSAKQWSEDTLAQAGFFDSAFAGTLTSYFSGDSDYSWERAIYEYAWADRTRGLESLGHILHLLEDMTVPDHTRNDPHPPYADFLFGQASPYEHWANQFDASTINANSILKSGDAPVFQPSLKSYFDSVAEYSNNNFFSKDTIKNDVYKLPNLNNVKDVRLKLSDGKFYFFVTNGIYLARYDEVVNLQTGELEKSYSLNDKDDLILSDYWSHLSRQAILNGAGTVKLFFDEVAKEKQTKFLYDKNRSWLEKQIDAFKSSVFGLAGILYGTSVSLNDLSSDAPQLQNAPQTQSQPQSQSAPQLQSQATSLQNFSVKPAAVVTPTVAESVSSPAVAALQPVQKISPAISPQLFFAPQDQAGPASGDSATLSSLGAPHDQAVSAALSNAASPPSSSAPVDATESTTTATTTLPVLSGLSDASSTPPDIILPDITPPDIQFSVSECGQTLSSSGCVIAATTIHLAWSSSADDLAQYAISCSQNNAPCENFSYGATHATSTEFSVQNNAAYTFSAKAKDTSGNESSPITKTVEIRQLPVVINEIAWMGTGGNATTSKDEWIELRSNTSEPVDLSGWSLALIKPGTTTPSHVISLSGTIAPRAYYLIERTDDSVISNIAADLITPFGPGLVDSGMTLQLWRNNIIIDQTPDAASGWIAGSLFERRTMERIDPLAEGANRANWGTYQQNEISENAKNAEGGAIHGTPRGRNGLNFLISQTGMVASDTTLTKENSPYVIASDGLIVKEGATLTIEPGTVIKFVSYQGPFLHVNGTLKSEGTAQEPVVMTSVYDDEYGGDTNQDGVCDPHNVSSARQCPQPGNWGALWFQPQSHDSELIHTIIRYGGKYFISMPFANIIGMVIADRASPRFDSARVEYSQTSGMALFGSSANITESEFLHNDKTDFNNVAGIFVNGGSPIITQSLFDHNLIGIQTEGQDGGEITGNTFTRQIGSAIVMFGGMVRFSGNQAHDNGLNAIDVMSASISHDYSLSADLPYVVGRDAPFQVRPGARLTIQAGVIMKFKPQSSGIAVEGSVDAQGTDLFPVVFTHFSDDDYGGDVNQDATATLPYAGGWGSISLLGSATSTLDHVVIRYGGADRSGVNANNSVLEMKHSIVENNKNCGVMFFQSTGSVSDSVIRNHIEPQGNGPMGLYVAQHSTVAAQNAVFRNNERGIVVDDTSVLINNGGIDIDGSNQTKTYPANLLP